MRKTSAKFASMPSPRLLNLSLTSHLSPCASLAYYNGLLILQHQASDAISCGLIATLFVQLSVLKIPISRSANSNILFRKLMIINWAFFVLS